MEHRYGQRLAIKLNVIVHRYGRLLGKFKLRDISIYGIFIETGELYLHLNTSVDLTFILSKETEEIHQVKGMIVRQNPEGIGLIFAKNYRQMFSSLNQQILDARKEKYPRIYEEEVLMADKDHGRSYRPNISGKYL